MRVSEKVTNTEFATAMGKLRKFTVKELKAELWKSINESLAIGTISSKLNRLASTIDKTTGYPKVNKFYSNGTQLPDGSKVYYTCSVEQMGALLHIEKEIVRKRLEGADQSLKWGEKIIGRPGETVSMKNR